MKKMILAALALCTAFAFAGEVTVLEKEIRVDSFRSLVDARFYIDQDTKEGFAKVAVSEERFAPGPYYPGPYYPGCYNNYCGGHIPRPMPIPVVVFQETVKIDNLMLMGDEVIYHGAEGSIVCGKMGVSRVFKRPTLFLSGKCDLEGRIEGGRRNSTLVVKLKTK